MSRDSLLKAIKSAAFLEGDFTTRAGKKTNYYIDKYYFETEPGILDSLATQLALLMPGPDMYDRIAAPELGAVSIAAVLSIKVGKPFIIVKKQSKEYGTQRLIEGRYHSGERVVVVEDILTTGGAALRACDIVKAEGLSVHSIVGVINREEGAFEAISERGITPVALFTTTDLKSC
ncbi:orotate phosphoribosyltransferase [bacterium]|nr:orotate phosphoribosyltransferase [bacterium]